MNIPCLFGWHSWFIPTTLNTEDMCCRRCDKPRYTYAERCGIVAYCTLYIGADGALLNIAKNQTRIEQLEKERT